MSRRPAGPTGRVGPARRFAGGRLVLATHNPGKVAELEASLLPHGVEVAGAAALGLPEPEETGETFEANAALKAMAAASATGSPALADDSGLAVAGLDGAPGVLSARWAGPGRDFGAAMGRVHGALAARYGTFERSDRRAAFVAALCLAWPDGHLEFARGRVDGTIAAEPRGTGGFGYDPIFVPEGAGLTFAEMPPEAKRGLSHRRRALDALIGRCFA